MLRMRMAAGGVINDDPLQVPAEALGDTDLLNVNMEIELFPADFSISGTATLSVRATVDNLTQFTVRLRNNFTASATMGGAPVTMVNQGVTSRVITLDRAYNTDETFSVTIAWSGVPVSRGFGSWYAQTQDGQPLFGTLSEPYYAYTWWPSKEGDTFEEGDNSDKATFQIAIIAPDNLTTVSNGVQQGTDALSGARKRTRWASTYPMAPYLACFSTGAYTQWSQSFVNANAPGGAMPVDYYIHPSSDNPGNRAAWEYSLGALGVFGDAYGDYPFLQEKYGVYQFPFGGGMEHQTMTGMGAFVDWITVHELSHQWWGDNVTCKTWHDIWLNEGFATYSEAIWYERRPGSSGAPALKQAMADRRPGNSDGSVYCYDTGNLGLMFSGDLVYRKGGWVLHMLRHVVGDTAFFQILANHRAAHQGGAATTADFASTVNTTTGGNFTGFFNQWIMGTGVPVYAFGYSPITVNGRSYVHVHLRQTQNTSFGNAGVFTMPVDVRAQTTGGPVNLTVMNDSRDQHFVVALPAPLQGSGAIAIDPDDWILNNGKTSEADVTGPPVVVETSPVPGATLESAASVSIWFSARVNAAASQFTVTGPSGTVAAGFAYNAAQQRVTLTLPASLPNGTYTVTVSDSLVSTVGALRLDGEINGNVLPSGNGQPQGNAVFSFSIQPPPPVCPADFNGDMVLNADDLSDFITGYFNTPADPRTDFNGDGAVNADDLGDFITAYFNGCP